MMSAVSDEIYQTNKNVSGILPAGKRKGLDILLKTSITPFPVVGMLLVCIPLKEGGRGVKGEKEESREWKECCRYLA